MPYALCPMPYALCPMPFFVRCSLGEVECLSLLDVALAKANALCLSFLIPSPFIKYHNPKSTALISDVTDM